MALAASRSASVMSTTEYVEADHLAFPSGSFALALRSRCSPRLQATTNQKSHSIYQSHGTQTGTPPPHDTKNALHSPVSPIEKFIRRHMNNKPLAPSSSIDQIPRNMNATAQRVWVTWALFGARTRNSLPTDMVKGPNVQRALIRAPCVAEDES